MGAWTHVLCSVCYAALEPGRQPHHIDDADEERCCRCGRTTVEGIYYRGDPKEFQCKGTHS